MARALGRRPRDADFRGNLFWLVDVIYACKSAQDPEMRRQARLLEDALGALGAYLETGEATQLRRTQDNVEAFARFVGVPLAPQGPSPVAKA